MKILIINSQSHIGGANTFIKNVYSAYSKKYERVDILENSITINHFKSIISRDYDLIVFNLYYPKDLILVIIARLFLVKSVLIVHGIFFLVSKSMNPKQNIIHSINEWFFQYLMLVLTTNIIAVCEFEHAQLTKYFPFINSKISVVYGAADHKTFSPKNRAKKGGITKKKDFKLLICSRFERRKGIEIALKSFKQILASYPEASLTLIFSTGVFNQLDYMTEVFTLIKTLGIGTKVELLTGISGSELSRYYQDSDMFLMSSTELEYCSLAVMESISCGCPVLSFKSGGTPEIVSNIGKEFVVNKISSEALAKRILWYANQSNNKKYKWREKTALIAKNYSWEKTASQIVRLI